MKVLMFESRQLPVIRWHLAKIMDKYEIKLKDLADKLDMTSSGVSHLKNCRKMPRLDSDRLTEIIDAVNQCLTEKPFDIKDRINLSDLIEWLPDDEAA
jgi:DNA-binding Xre family transcriptional regulator